MKKKLEAELVSIAHRILQMKNKSDLNQLHQETQKLYEKLSVLRFVEEHFADLKPTIGHAEVEERLSTVFDNEIPNRTDSEASTPIETTTEPLEKNDQAVGDKPSEISEIANQASEAAPEEAKPEAVDEIQTEPEQSGESVAANAPETAQETPSASEPEPEVPVAETPQADEKLFKPAFEWSFDAKADEAKTETPKMTPAQISFDDLLGQDYVDPVFVKPDEVDTPIPASAPTSDMQAPHVPETNVSDDDRRAAELAESNRRLADLRQATNRPIAEQIEAKQNVIPISRNFSDTSNVISINKENLNDRISKGITIGLNDRIAFMKHLFDNSSEDYNRVLSQLITFDTLSEARDFIDNVVKPDYNNWDGKDEYEQRFMEIIEKKFS